MHVNILFMCSFKYKKEQTIVSSQFFYTASEKNARALCDKANLLLFFIKTLRPSFWDLDRFSIHFANPPKQIKSILKYSCVDGRYRIEVESDSLLCRLVDLMTSCGSEFYGKWSSTGPLLEPSVEPVYFNFGDRRLVFVLDEFYLFCVSAELEQFRWSFIGNEFRYKNPHLVTVLQLMQHYNPRMAINIEGPYSEPKQDWVHPPEGTFSFFG